MFSSLSTSNSPPVFQLDTPLAAPHGICKGTLRNHGIIHILIRRITCVPSTPTFLAILLTISVTLVVAMKPFLLFFPRNQNEPIVPTVFSIDRLTCPELLSVLQVSPSWLRTPSMMTHYPLKPSVEQAKDRNRPLSHEVNGAFQK